MKRSWVDEVAQKCFSYRVWHFQATGIENMTDLENLLLILNINYFLMLLISI